MKTNLIVLIFASCLSVQLGFASPNWKICSVSGELSFYNAKKKIWENNLTVSRSKSISLSEKDSLLIADEVVIAANNKKKNRYSVGKAGKWSVRDILDGKALCVYSNEVPATGDAVRTTELSAMRKKLEFSMYSALSGSKTDHIKIGEPLFAVIANHTQQPLYAVIYWVEMYPGRKPYERNLLSSSESQLVTPERLTVLQWQQEQYERQSSMEQTVTKIQATIFCVYDTEPFTIPEGATLQKIRECRMCESVVLTLEGNYLRDHKSR